MAITCRASTGFPAAIGLQLDFPFGPAGHKTTRATPRYGRRVDNSVITRTSKPGMAPPPPTFSADAIRLALIGNVADAYKNTKDERSVRHFAMDEHETIIFACLPKPRPRRLFELFTVYLEQLNKNPDGHKWLLKEYQSVDIGLLAIIFHQKEPYPTWQHLAVQVNSQIDDMAACRNSINPFYYRGKLPDITWSST